MGIRVPAAKLIKNRVEEVAGIDPGCKESSGAAEILVAVSTGASDRKLEVAGLVGVEDLPIVQRMSLLMFVQWPLEP